MVIVVFPSAFYELRLLSTFSLDLCVCFHSVGSPLLGLILPGSQVKVWDLDSKKTVTITPESAPTSVSVSYELRLVVIGTQSGIPAAGSVSILKAEN